MLQYDYDVQLTILFMKAGGMFITGSTSVIQHCIVTNNYAYYVSTTVFLIFYL
jgi:hypothetical protein